MSLYAKLALVLLILVAGFVAGVKVEKGFQAQREVAARQEADRMRAKHETAIDQAAVAHESDKVRIVERFTVITEKVEDAKNTPFYAAGAPACLDAAGVRLVNEAARAADAASQPAPALPRTAAPEGRRADEHAGLDGADQQAVRRMPVPPSTHRRSVAALEPATSASQGCSRCAGLFDLSLAIQPLTARA